MLECSHPSHCVLLEQICPQQRITQRKTTDPQLFVMKLFLLFSSLLTVHSFIPHTPTFVRHAVVATKAIAGDIDASAEQRLDEIASKLKLQVYDVDTSVYGIDSKDPLYGIENIHTNVRMDTDGSLGLELVSQSFAIYIDHCCGRVLTSMPFSCHTDSSCPFRSGSSWIGTRLQSL